MKIIFNLEKTDVLKRLEKIDFVCTDLDECLFPFYTQVLIVGELILEALFKRNKWKYLPRLVIGAMFVAFLIIITFGKVKIFGNAFLMHCFSWTVRGIPIELIKRHAKYIHNFFYTDSLNFLKLLHKRGASILILSLSIQTILDELQKNIGFIEYVCGNKIIIKEEKFYSYVFDNNRGPEDKLKEYLKVLRKLNAKTPLVIGHSDDEIRMVDDARKREGLSIGINPKKYLYDKFDIVLESVNWSPLLELVKNLELK